jgi:hypothetical protein
MEVFGQHDTIQLCGQSGRSICRLNHTGVAGPQRFEHDDDFEGSVREIDLLAYKASKAQPFSVYTTLLVSCKKNLSNAWALLARDINLKDPNSDWWPMHVWTNDKSLNYELSLPGQSRTYHDGVKELGVQEALAPTVGPLRVPPLSSNVRHVLIKNFWPQQKACRSN